MFREAFEKLDLADVATILDQVNPLMEGITFDPVETVIMAIDVPFYPGHRLLDIADYSSMPASHRHVIYHPKGSVVLNFTNEPIYALNQKTKLKLTESTVTEYVRFFFSFVRGRHGRFLVVESVDDIHWKEDPPPAARKAIGKMVLPITVTKQEENGTFHLQATMMFRDSLFKSSVVVQPDGVLKLNNEELLIEDMPVLDDTFGQ
jgi:hypothetical protein